MMAPEIKEKDNGEATLLSKFKNHSFIMIFSTYKKL